MARLFMTNHPEEDLPVFYNVDAVVGATPSDNKREDVLLVQFCLERVAKQPLPDSNPEAVAEAKAVKTTGVIDPATINAIRGIQKRNKGSIVDGRVSPCKMEYFYGSGAFTIVHLNLSLHRRHSDVWPRIDKIPGCPDELVQMVKRTCIGKPK